MDPLVVAMREANSSVGTGTPVSSETVRLLLDYIARLEEALLDEGLGRNVSEYGMET